MNSEMLVHHPERLNLPVVSAALSDVETHWTQIDDELDRLKIGRRDTPFQGIVRERMMSAYTELDRLLVQGVEPFSLNSLPEMIILNNRVHYGNDQRLMIEYGGAIDATVKKFYKKISPIADRYHKHKKRGDHPYRLAAEVYVSILGFPQLFVEGNHRTGAIIASWVNMHHGLPPFVLSPENAIAYFAPSAEIKRFSDRTSWRDKLKPPKYRKSFGEFWERQCDSRFMVK